MRGFKVSTLLVTAIASAVIAARPAPAEEGATYAALQIAYDREMNARSRDLAYAARAEREGHPGTGCMFTAVARAESVHAANHAVAIRRLGGVPRWQLASTVVRGTRENLRTAIDNERREHDAVYPRLAAFARAEFLYDALASLNYARSAEATHATLFAHALERLATQDPGPPLLVLLVVGSLAPPEPVSSCHVCLGDGSVYLQPMKRCPNCGSGQFVAFGCPGPR